MFAMMVTPESQIKPQNSVGLVLTVQVTRKQFYILCSQTVLIFY